MLTVEELYSSIMNGKVEFNYEAISPIELSKCFKENDHIPTTLIGGNLSIPLRIYYSVYLATISCVVNNAVEVFYIKPPTTFDLYEKLILLSLEKKKKIAHETSSGRLMFRDMISGGTIITNRSELSEGFFEKYLANNVTNHRDF